MSETYTPDNLMAGAFPVVTESVTITSGQNLARGSVLGKVTATGNYILCDAAAVDGSQAPTHILLQAVDASLAAAPGLVALSGEFNEDQITLGGTTTAANVKAALRALNIYLKAPSN